MFYNKNSILSKNEKEINIIKVTEKEMLDKLYKDNAFTIEGIPEKDFGKVVDFIKNYTAFKTQDENLYIIKGIVMNEIYHLTGKNRYPDDLHILSIMLSVLENPLSIVMPRFSIGGRWFNDVVDNNQRREDGKGLIDLISTKKG